MISRRGQRTGLDVLTGDSVDISKYTDFKFYNFIWYWKTSHNFGIQITKTVDEAL